jgi:L-alanine-DL-glutamate epimerase-like enolase superfamily enzyme
MKIHDLEFFLAAVAQSESPAPTRSLLVRITTASGIEGWGESSLAWRMGELLARREALLAVLAGRSVYDIEELHTIEALSPAPLRSAVEMAVWDLLGRVLHQPLCNLLGGYYRRRVPVSIRLAGHHAKNVAHVSRELAEQGFHTQTLASSGRPDEDVRNLNAIREMVGNRVELRLDGLSQFDMETARDLCADLEFNDLQFFLDPLKMPELHAMAALGRQTSVPLAAGRAIRSPADVLTAIRCNAAPFLKIDLEQVGGIVPARACAAVAAAAGVIPLLGGRSSLGIAAAAMLHLAAAISAFSTANEIAARQLRDSVLTDSFEIADGMMLVPQSHGLGVEVDRVKVEQHQPVA